MASNELGALKTILRKRYKVPDVLIDQMLLIMTNEAIREAQAMQYDRVLAGFALALARLHGWGQQRIVRVLREFDDIAGQLGESGDSWTDVMEELDERTGIVIHPADGKRFVMEYRGNNWRRRKEIEDAEQEQ